MASLPPGTPIGGGRYTVVRELNRGGTAVVYEGLDAATGATVALKVMSARDGRMTVSMKGVRRELEDASSVRRWVGWFGLFTSASEKPLAARCSLSAHKGAAFAPLDMRF